MAKQRYINTKFWSDGFVSELNPLDRYLFLYFLTNEHTNIAGIYELPLKTISFETGIELDMLKKMLKRLNGKVIYIDGWVYVKNFAKHQAVNDSIIKGIEVARKSIPQEIINKIKEIDQAPPSLSPASPQDPTYLNLNSNLNLNLNSNIAGTSPAETIELIKAFEAINPAVKSMYGNKTQRKACNDLIETYGFERVKSVIEKTLPRTNQMEYMPTITTPLQLFTKWSSLEAGILKFKGKQKDKPKIAFQ